MEKKQWYKSKTIWSGIVAIIIAAYNSAAASFGFPAIPEFVYGLLGAVGIYGRTTANSSIK